MIHFLRKGYFLLVILFFFLNNVYASFYQQPSPDTLLKQARHASETSNGIKLAKQAVKLAENQSNLSVLIKSLNFISAAYWDLRQFDSTRFYANRALSIATKNEIDSLKGDGWVNLGMADSELGLLKQAINEYEKAGEFYKKAGKISSLATSFLNLGICERRLSQYSIAIGYFLKSAKIYDTLKDHEGLSYSYNSIANCFVELKKFDQAVFYNKMALKIRQALNDQELIAISCNNIGFVYIQKHKPDSSIYFLSKSFDIRKHFKDSSALVLILQNLGSAYMMKNELFRAERYISRSQRIAANYDMEEELARGSADLAEIFIRQAKYPQALNAINFTINSVKKKNLPELLLEAYSTKYTVYNQSGDYKNALIYLNKKIALQDSLFTLQKNRDIEEMNTKYQTDQKIKDIKNLSLQNTLQNNIVKQQRTSITILIISAALLIILFAITYRNFRAKQKANLRIQTLMRDLHHRVKNNLQILSGLFTMQIENLSDENTKNALRENEARLTSMNLIHNKLYLNNTTTKIEMSDYLTNLLNHIRDSFGSQKQNMIDLRIEVSNVMLEADKAVAIGLIANELATNAFKYAFNDQGGEIYLALKFVEKSKLLLTLCDNGIGIDEEKNKNKAPSFGLRLVNLMARQLNSTLVVTNNPGVSYQMEISV